MTCANQSYFSDQIYFFTVRLADPHASVLVDHIDLFRDCVRLALARNPFQIRAACILPSEASMVWQLPVDDANYVKRWRLIKSTFARHIPAVSGGADIHRAGDGSIWQRGLWETRLRSTADLTLHNLHCLTSPVRAGLVDRPEDWPHSSIGRAPSRRKKRSSAVAGIAKEARTQTMA